MSDNPKEVEKMMKKDGIFICADVWSDVFRLLPPYQLGLRVALVNRRFDALVDGHFATRKWTFDRLEIGVTGKNGIREMQIRKRFNAYKYEVLPIPDADIPLPNKVVGFKAIQIAFFDSDVMAFLYRLRSLFSSACVGINLRFIPSGKRDYEQKMPFLRNNIWPLVKENICAMDLYSRSGEHMRQFSLLNIHCDCPSLKLVKILYYPLSELFRDELPASNDHEHTCYSGQRTVIKWLLTTRADGTPKMLNSNVWGDEQFLAKIQTFKRQFLNSSSRDNFIIVMWAISVESIIEFAVNNELTGEQLALKKHNGIGQYDRNDEACLLVRCPISRDESQWAKWEEEAIGWRWKKQWNRIGIYFNDITELHPSIR